MTALAVGSLAGLVLGVGGIASAQTTETPAPGPSPTTPEAEPEQDATPDRLCDEDDAGAGGAAEPESATTAA